MLGKTPIWPRTICGKYTWAPEFGKPRWWPTWLSWPCGLGATTFSGDLVTEGPRSPVWGALRQLPLVGGRRRECSLGAIVRTSAQAVYETEQILCGTSDG